MEVGESKLLTFLSFFVVDKKWHLKLFLFFLMNLRLFNLGFIFDTRLVEGLICVSHICHLWLFYLAISMILRWSWGWSFGVFINKRWGHELIEDTPSFSFLLSGLLRFMALNIGGRDVIMEHNSFWQRFLVPNIISFLWTFSSDRFSLINCTSSSNRFVLFLIVDNFEQIPMWIRRLNSSFLNRDIADVFVWIGVIVWIHCFFDYKSFCQNSVLISL